MGRVYEIEKGRLTERLTPPLRGAESDTGT